MCPVTKFFTTDLKRLRSWDKILILSGRWLKTLTHEQCTPFCTIVRFVLMRWKLWLYRVFILCISELDKNNPLFLITNTSSEYIYCEGTVRIWRVLNSCRQESRLSLLVIILIILFCILKTLALRRELLQKIIP